MKYSGKVLNIGLILGAAPLFTDIMGIPMKYTWFLNPLGLLIVGISCFIYFFEKYKVIPREENEDE